MNRAAKQRALFVCCLLAAVFTAFSAKLKRRKISEATGEALASRYIVLKKDVPEANAVEIAEAMSAAKQRGIFFEPDSIRRYPNNALLSHVIGFTNSDNVGADGIERT